MLPWFMTYVECLIGYQTHNNKFNGTRKVGCVRTSQIIANIT